MRTKSIDSPELKKYFWEVDLSKLDYKEDAEYIIGRILEYGDISTVRQLLKIYDKDLIKKTLIHCRKFSPRSANFWRLFFGLNQDRILCLKKSYQNMQSTHWPYIGKSGLFRLEKG